MKKGFYKYGNLLAFVAVVVINILATLGVLGGVTTRDVSYMYKSLLTPADYAFSIWSVIYVLIAIMVYQQMCKDEVREKLCNLFMISCILNIGWIFAWQFKAIGISFVLILLLLLDLILIMRKMKEDVNLPSSAIGLYTGWINVAMLANLGTLFVKNGWSLFGWEASITAVVGLTFGILWISCFLYMYTNVFYALGAIWGYLGIFIASDVFGVKLVSIIGMTVFAIIAIFELLQKKMLTKN